MGLPIIGDIINAAKDIISEVVVDKDKKRELDVRLQELADEMDARYHEEVMGQLEINKVEAAHDSIFVAGWRPFIGWIGGIGFGYNVFIAPMFKLGIADVGFLSTILLAILGVGTMRTYEKVKGVNTNGPSITQTVKKILPENVPWAKADAS